MDVIADGDDGDVVADACEATASERPAPEELIDRMNEEHKTDFTDFGISYDNYTSTHSEFNRQIVEKIYANLDAAGHIARRDIEQLYDEQEGMFLPDRFIRGTCPKCKTPDQYGDSCEACGSTYSPTDLIEPRSAVSGTTPVLRETEHYFVRLEEGFRIVFVGPFSDAGEQYLGS